MKVEELRTKSGEPSFWNDQIAAQKTLQEIKSLEQWINLYKDVDKKVNDVKDIIELAGMEEDESFYDEIRKIDEQRGDETRHGFLKKIIVEHIKNA